MKLLKLLKYSPLSLAVACGASQAALLSGFGGSASALSGSTATIDFETESTQSFTSLTINGVTFSSTSSLSLNNTYGGQYNTQGLSINNTGGYALRVDFSGTIGAFAFNMGAGNVPWTLTAYDSTDTQIESHSVEQTNPSSNSGDYFGISSPNISYFILSTTAYDYILFDDLVYLANLLNVEQSTLNAGNNPALPAAIVIDSNSALQNLFASLSGDEAISNAVSQTLPAFAGAGSLAARNALSGINGAVGARQDANQGLSSGDIMLSDQHFWIQPFGTWSKQGERKGVSGFDADTGGLVLGLDSLINDQTRLGLALAYANTNVEGNSTTAPQSLLIDTYQLIGYGSRALNENTDLTFQVDVGRNRNQGQRIIAFTSSVAESDYDSYSAHLGTGVSRTYEINDTNRAIATAKADYTWIKDESYTESGAGVLNLDVESNTTEALVAGVEGQLIHTLNPTTELNAKLGVGYDLINEEAGITSSFAGAPSAQFTTEGLDPSPWIATAGFGLVHTAETGAEISANYDAEYRSDYLSQTASVKLRLPF